NVRRHQIGGELDPFEVEAECAGDCAHEESLRRSRHSLEKRVPSRDKRDEGVIYYLFLSENALAYRRTNTPERFRRAGGGHWITHAFTLLSMCSIDLPMPIIC